MVAEEPNQRTERQVALDYHEYPRPGDPAD